MQRRHNAVSTDKPYKMGMQQDPSLLFIQAVPWTNLKSMNFQEEEKEKGQMSNQFQPTFP